MRIHCTHCTNILFSNIAVKSEGPATITIETRCPHCKHPVKLKIDTEVVAHVSLNGVRVQAAEQSTDSEAPRIL